MLDSETLKIEGEGQTIADFVRSDGWNIAKRMLLEKVNLTDSLSSTIFEGKTAEQLALEIQSRANSVQIIREWLAQVEGTAHQHESNKAALNPKDELILRL